MDKWTRPRGHILASPVLLCVPHRSMAALSFQFFERLGTPDFGSKEDFAVLPNPREETRRRALTARSLIFSKLDPVGFD
jgi:hypothetical protein